MPAWLQRLALVTATVMVALVAIAAGTQLADWRAQRGSAAGQVQERATAARCDGYPAPDRNVPAEVQHLKTGAVVLEVLSPCTVRVQVSGGAGTLAAFTGKTITLRVTPETTFSTAQKGDLTAFSRLDLKPQQTFTLSFDSRAFADGSYPLNFMNR